jgi:spore coat polysaccharide biosynthesis protein SpsF (cytidylyltransferase family)
MTSNRLLGKAIKKILDKESIVRLIDRMKRIKNSDDVILATSTDKSDDILVDIAIREKINFYRGSLDNVASRYYEAAKKFSLDQIVRVTGDAILCDDIMLQKAISSQISKGSDVTFIKNMPYGTAKEVFNFRTIEAISKYAKIPSNTEYLEWFLENSRNFKVEYIKSPYKFNKRIRLTLDFEEDLLQLNKIFSALKHLNGEFSLKDVLKYLDKNPKIININSHLNPKFKKEQINTELKI